MDVAMFTVGLVQENCFLVIGSAPAEGEPRRALIVDPGDEAPRLLAAIEDAGVTLDAILLTHTHFDHVGAVAPLARATGAPVYCPVIELPALQDIDAFVPWPGFGPFESWDPEHTIEGGETLELAGMTFDVLFTPGHSPGHVTFATREHDGEPTQLFSGDVLFSGSVGRVDFPGGDGPTLIGSIALLLDSFEDDARVYPGHMGLTTLGAERATNPFLTQLLNR